MMRSPARSVSPKLSSFVASQATELKGWPSTASPRPCRLRAVHPHARHELREIARLRGRHRRPEHEGELLGVVGERERDLADEVAARLDDLERRMDRADRGRDHLEGRAGRHIARELDAELVLEARANEIRIFEGVAARDLAFLEQAAEHGLV